MKPLLARVRYATGELPMAAGSGWLRLLLLRNSASRSRTKTEAGTAPAKRLKRMSRKMRLPRERTAVGKAPVWALLLTSSSRRYRSSERSGMGPDKLLELEWK